MNVTTLFANVRRAPFGGQLTQAQIDGMNAILAEWDTASVSKPYVGRIGNSHP